MKEIISNKQGIFIMTMFIVGSFIVLGTGGDAKQDAWIAIILAFLMSLPILFVYSKILMLYPGKDLFDILIMVFGSIPGKILSIFFVWYSLHLGSLVIRNFSEFVNVVSFPETPQFIIIIFLGLLCIWVIKAGIEVLGRCATFIFPIVSGIILLTILLSMANVHFINLKPVLYNGMKPVLISAFSIFSFPFAETVVFTVVFNSLKHVNKTYRVFLISILIGSIIMLMVTVRNILVLGAQITSDLYFPSYIAVRTINIGEFLQRLEIVVAITYITGGFVKISVCLYAASKGVAKILNIDNYRHIVAPIGFLMMNLACIIYNNTMEMFEWASKIYQYYAIPFQIILPVFILIAAKLKQGIGKNEI